ncbi:putative choline dehydrogenase [Lasiosphaeria miniovina]|uniref:Choline dehydrogenase n=1 Tax=Lasiosphaeria miniovina TaxID=1954250 RepID=A0AA40E0Y7_9PEZI|nr:putative choline dehydrogenase [Lasiosphaeria miniovina]KAK0718653.1 putative choline dehydrogenase [Lasiosphaeria miniovina]
MDSQHVTAEAFAARQFDFLVVGGGTAGLAVAARLSEDPRLVVGVLEAGSSAFGDEAVELPGLAGRALGTDLDWNFETVPQPGLGGRAVPWARGKVLGGSSALNFMTWNRGSRGDYDAWAELGNAGWGWDHLLPFFKKSETFHAPTSDSQAAARAASSHPGLVGLTGPIQISYPMEYTSSHAHWHRTLDSVGIAAGDSQLGGTNVGCWTSLCSVDPLNATRSYSATSYYRPNTSRPNLVVLAGAEVSEILLDQVEGAGWKARGVRFAHGGNEFSAFASREVVVSAGSIKSPHLLELSGVGGAAVLSAAGISVKVDNANVGENLQDHLTTTLVFEVDSSLRNPDDLKLDEHLAEAHEEYARYRTGPLTVLPVSMAYVPVSHFVPQETIDAILSTAPATQPPNSNVFAERDSILRRRFSPQAQTLGHVEYIFDLGNWGADFVPDASSGKKYASMLQILQYPFSRGSVHVKPAHKLGPHETDEKGIAIDPQYYAGHQGHVDLEIAMHCHRFAETICAAQPLASILRGQVCPLPFESRSDGDLRAWLKRNMVTDWHPVGTCAMGGRGGARTGVVDERLRVYGVEGLRVVDASVMPLQISAHLQATVYAIAEKAAHMILEDIRFDFKLHFQ